jgi:hypothetical protein
MSQQQSRDRGRARCGPLGLRSDERDVSAASAFGRPPRVAVNSETRQFAAGSASGSRESQSLVDKPFRHARPGREPQVTFADAMMPRKELRDLRGRAEHWRFLATQIHDRLVVEAVTARLHRIETQIAEMEAEMSQNTPAPGLDRHANQPKSLSVPRSVGVSGEELTPLSKTAVHQRPDRLRATPAGRRSVVSNKAVDGRLNPRKCSEPAV